MASTSLAQEKTPIITEELQARVRRGRRFFEEHSDEIRYVAPAALWCVPSPSGGFYAVGLDPERCECASYEHMGGRPCEHIVAASIAKAKSRTCSCCRERVLGRFTTEVSEDDGLLSWYPGDVLCTGCVRRGFWV